MALGQQVAIGVALVGAVVLFAGCKGKNANMASGGGQSSSVAYEDPSTDYYAPGATTTSSYNDGSAGVSGGNRHVVAKGDTLYSLARAYYSDQSKWRTIYDANRSSIPDPNKLKVGQELVIP
jgi:5'-nucleotidase